MTLRDCQTFPKRSSSEKRSHRSGAPHYPRPHPEAAQRVTGEVYSCSQTCHLMNDRTENERKLVTTDAAANCKVAVVMDPFRTYGVLGRTDFLG